MTINLTDDQRDQLSELLPHWIDLDAFLAFASDDPLLTADILLDDKDRREQTVADFDEAFMGEYASGADFAENYAIGCGYLNDADRWPYTHIDWDAAWDSDLRHDFWIARDGYRVYVFREL